MKLSNVAMLVTGLGVLLIASATGRSDHSNGLPLTVSVKDMQLIDRIGVQQDQAATQAKYRYWRSGLDYLPKAPL